MRDLLQIFRESRPKVISVDVFDTLLLRDTKPELSRFKDISARQARELRKGGVGITDEDFYLLRREAARTAYSMRPAVHQAREANWTEILTLVFNALRIERPEEHLASCLSAELGYEQEVLRLNDSLWETMVRFREEGIALICLSDMYLSSGAIASLIDRVAGVSTNLEVWSSADLGYGKSSGGLFKKLAIEKSVSFEEIVHVGDNRHADCLVPQQLGIRAIHYPRTVPWRLVQKTRHFLFNRQLSAL